MFVNSIRWRLQLWHGLILLLVLAGFGLTAYQLERVNRLRQVDQELDRRLTVVLGALRRNAPRPPRPAEPSGPDEAPGPPPPRRPLPPPERAPFSASDLGLFDGNGPGSYYCILWRRDGIELLRSDAAPAGISMPAKDMTKTARTRDNLREMYFFTPPGECILVGLDLSGEFGEMRRLACLLLAAGGAVLLMGLAGGWWFSTRAIRSLEDISAAADRIATGQLSQRINVADTDNELGRLAVLLNSTFARLEAAFAQQQQFTSDAAHELRTPLAVILAHVQTSLKRERTSAEYKLTLESCLRAAQRMRKLVESLLDLAQFDAGQQQLKHFPFDLAETAQDCLDLLQPLAEARGIKLSAKLPSLFCVGDPERISQVITNLLTNAVEYNKPGGEVRVEAQSKNGMACVDVADTGPGIPSEELPHVFERFFRVDKSRSTVHAGLGLAIAKAIIEAHGGSISVSSTTGAGTTFSFQLPQQRSQKNALGSSKPVTSNR